MDRKAMAVAIVCAIATLLATTLPTGTTRVVAATSGRRRVLRSALAIEPVGGLSNRLRAYVSAKALALLTNRRLVVVWRPSIHCNASFEALFGTTEHVVTAYKTARRTVSYDYDARKNEVIASRSLDDIYVKSRYVLVSDRSEKPPLRAVFAGLIPSSAVAHIVQSSYGDDPTIAVHVRMLSNTTTDVPGIAESAADGSAAAHRRNCHWTAFVQPLRHLVHRVGAAHVLVDSDTPGVGDRLLRAAGAAGETLPTPDACYERERRQQACVQHALAHILLLSRASVLLLSEWSSYSEAVRWFANRRALVVHGCRPPSRAERSAPPAAEHSDVSVVLGCQDRNTYAAVVEGVRRVYGDRVELIVVDWSSRARVSNVPRGTVLRVVDLDGQWNLAQAYNLGIRHSTRKYVLKLDCDTHVTCAPPLPAPGTFRAGSWREGGDGGHLNGVLFAKRSDLLSVGLYDERFARYGWDDSDLYERLSVAVERTSIGSCVRHMSHGDALRRVRDPVQAQVFAQANRFCARGARWNNASAHSAYRRALSPRDGLMQVWSPRPISASASCNYRLAIASVLHKLFNKCVDPQCDRRFWKVVQTEWSTARELVMRLLPGDMDIGLACLRSWRSFVPIESVADCLMALRRFENATA